MTTRAQRGPLLQELTRANPWWTNPGWAAADPYLTAAARAPFERAPMVLDDIAPHNLYSRRDAGRAKKSTLVK